MIPSKGKGKEGTQWSSGWWEYHALLDQTQRYALYAALRYYLLIECRPVVWSSTSTIFSAHPSQPLVTARHFSSSKQFVLQSPGPILSSPSSYEPPTVVSVSPGGDWLFAYFPSGEIDGVGCLWQRGAPIDVWGVKEWWTLNRGGGIVTADWLGGPREVALIILSTTDTHRFLSGPSTMQGRRPAFRLEVRGHQYPIRLSFW